MWKSNMRGRKKNVCKGHYVWRKKRRELRLVCSKTGEVWEYPSWQAARKDGWRK